MLDHNWLHACDLCLYLVGLFQCPSLSAFSFFLVCPLSADLLVFVAFNTALRVRLISPVMLASLCACHQYLEFLCNVLEQLDSDIRNVFNDLQLDILDLLQTNAFHRFRESATFQQLLQTHTALRFQEARAQSQMQIRSQHVNSDRSQLDALSLHSAGSLVKPSDTAGVGLSSPMRGHVSFAASSRPGVVSDLSP